MMMFTIKRLCNGDIIFGNYCELCNNSIIWLPSSVIATENDMLYLLFGWCLTGTPTLTYFKMFLGRTSFLGIDILKFRNINFAKKKVYSLPAPSFFPQPTAFMLLNSLLFTTIWYEIYLFVIHVLCFLVSLCFSSLDTFSCHWNMSLPVGEQHIHKLHDEERVCRVFRVNEQTSVGYFSSYTKRPINNFLSELNVQYWTF